MAHSHPDLIQALRQTAARLKGGARYEWGHMGRCNCGHLVQTVTHLSDRQIVQSVEGKLDEWTEHAKDYCATTGHRVDDLFDALAQIGFSHTDVVHLEHLSDPRVLERLPGEARHLERNNPEHVALYMRTLADMLD